MKSAQSVATPVKTETWITIQSLHRYPQILAMTFMVSRLPIVSTCSAKTERPIVKIIHGSPLIKCRVRRYNHHQFCSQTIQTRQDSNSKKKSILYQTAQTASLSQLLKMVIAKASSLTSALMFQAM